MIELMILQIVGLISIGHSINSILLPSINETKRVQVFESLIFSTITGYAFLIFPILIASLLFDQILNYVIIIQFVLINASLLYFFYSGSTWLRSLRSLNFSKNLTNNPLDITILILILGYLFLSIIYFPRGWDALQFYIPNAYYFFIVDDIIPGINPLTSLPTFKPPMASIFILFGFYIGNSFVANLHPWLLFTSTSLIVYNLCLCYDLSEFQAKIAQITFLTLPISYFLIYEYQYYQEIPLMFFFSASLYILIKYKNSPTIYAVFCSISISLAILSKISGYSLLILLPLLIKWNKQSIWITRGFILSLTIFLLRKAIYSIFFPSILVILLVGLVLFKLSGNQSNLIKFKLKTIFSTVFLPIIVGITWIHFMIQIPGIKENLFETFLKLNTPKLILEFSALSPIVTYVENGMGVSFWMSFSYIFIGMLLSPLLLLFKLKGYFGRELPELKIWMIAFFLIWYSYFGTVSARYLVPILVPFSIIISRGIMFFISSFGMKRQNAIMVVFLITGSSYLLYYPFIPLRFLLLQTNFRYYMFHKSLLLLLIYPIIIFKLIIITAQNFKLPSKIEVKFLFLLAVFTGIFPFTPQFVVYSSTGFNQQEFNKRMNYIYRAQYQELISNINSNPIEFDKTILSVNTPGLAYFISRTVFDLIQVKDHELRQKLQMQQEYEVLQVIQDLSIEIIIGLNSSHVYYDQYLRAYAILQIYKITANSSLFILRFFNSEFVMYQLKI